MSRITRSTPASRTAGVAAPKSLWGYMAQRFGWSLFPVGYRIHFKD